MHHFFLKVNVDKILFNSNLKDVSFSVNVKELVSDKHQIKAFLIEEHANPIIAIDFMFKNSGKIADKSTKLGTANLLASSLTEGAGRYNAQSLKELLDENAIVLNFIATDDDFEISVKTTKDM